MTQTIALRPDNPYAYGELAILNDGTYCLSGTKQTPNTTNCRIYTTIDGDTLSNIAYEAYGNSKYWWLIYYSNDIDCPFDLELNGGVTLKIPNLNLL